MNKTNNKSRKRPTILDVARLSETSVGTVSRVLNKNASVRPAIKERVLQAVEELGYRPSLVAQGMRTQATHAIGFVIPDVCNPIFAMMVRAAEEVLLESGYSLVLANTDLKPAREAQIIGAFAHRRIDALIMAVSDENNEELLKAMERLEMPVVLLNRELAGGFDSVLIDDFNGARQATEFLIGLGHRRISIITAAENISPGRQRVAGFRKAFEDAGLAVDEQLIRRGSFEMDGYREAFAVLDSSDPATAMIVGTQVLVGVLRALRQLQIKIPDDLSLISCDDVHLAELASPPLTVLDRNLAECGRMAARLVMLRLQGNGADRQQRIVLPTRLIRRSSCSAPGNRLSSALPKLTPSALQGNERSNRK